MTSEADAYSEAPCDAIRPLIIDAGDSLFRADRLVSFHIWSHHGRNIQYVALTCWRL